MVTVRVLRTGDEEALEQFLRHHPDTTMFLRSNARAAGLDDHGKRYQGTYAAAFEGGEITAVAGHYWNGNVLLEAPVHLEAVVMAAVGASPRPVQGVVASEDQRQAVSTLLGLHEAKVQFDSRQDLFALDLRRLQVPPALASGAVATRAPREDEIDLLTEWRVGYCMETMGDEDGPLLRAACRAALIGSREERRGWVLVDEDRPVAYSGFNAVLPDCVQVGGVWTPVDLRGRGYGRSVVAGSLLDARRGGVERSILFTDEDNYAAQAAYRALGYERVGDYGILLLAEPFDVRHRL